MDALVRKLAALSVLWSMCELLLSEGRQRAAVRMTVSALVMITLLSAVNELLSSAAPNSSAAPAMPALSAAMPKESEYAAAALRSLANQAKAVAERFAERAGYDCAAVVYLRLDGSLDHMTLKLDRRGGATALLSERETARRLAELFKTDEASIRLTDGADKE